MVDSKAIRNYIILKVVEWLGIIYKEKKKSYLLVIILGELILLVTQGNLLVTTTQVNTVMMVNKIDY